MIKGLGPVTIRNLVSYCGSPENVFSTPKGKLLKIPGIGEKTLKLLKEAESYQKKAEDEVRFCEKHQIAILPYLSTEYPQALKFLHDSPTVLYKRGNIDLNQHEMIAVVGTRKPTEYGKNMAEQIATYFAERNMNVVSGLAYGIDIAAHKAALKVGGMTTAVLAHGLDRIYPTMHYEKAMEMLEIGGWVSEFPSGTSPDAPNFPARNRIISGLAKAIIVVEAAKSGGALITANFGFEQNKEIYAVPGNVGLPFSEGCNHLIQNNIAKLLTHPQEVLSDLDIQWNNEIVENFHKIEPKKDFSNVILSAEETRIVGLLRKGEAQIDDISIQTEISIASLNSLLLTMEFKGFIKQMPGKKFSLMEAKW